MEYFKASREHGELIFNLVQDTINAVYPRYYPKPVVEFFCGINSRDNINRDIEEGCVRVLWKDGRLVGTGSRKGNHITRVFVAPELQGQGCGSCIMEKLKDEIAQEFRFICLDASLPAVHFYENMGYKTVGHGRIEVGNNAILIYDMMEKQLCGQNSADID